MPAIAAAPAFYGAIASGVAGVTGTALASRAQGKGNDRAMAASERAAQRAEAFTREQDAQNRADEARQDAEDRRRWEVEQANVARQQQQEDALLKDNLARSSYEDAIRYGKMVNLARLTGQPVPERPPERLAGSLLTDPTIASLSKVPTSAPLMSRPSTANQMIAQPGAVEPMGANSHLGWGDNLPTQTLGRSSRMPMSNLVGKRRVI